MAGGAAFGLDRQVLEGERSALFRVALETDLVLRRVQLRLLGTAVVYVVTVTALDETFVDAVMEGAIEVCPGVVVTAIAKLRCFRLQQKVLLLRVMRRVARDAAHIILEVIGAQEIRMSIAVAGETSLTDLRGSGSREE